MKIWCFCFADERWPIASARVAAPSRKGAFDIMAAGLGVPLNPATDRRSDDGVICSYMGEQPCASGIVSYVRRNEARIA